MFVNMWFGSLLVSTSVRAWTKVVVHLNSLSWFMGNHSHDKYHYSISFPSSPSFLCPLICALQAHLHRGWGQSEVTQQGGDDDLEKKENDCALSGGL